MPKRSLVLGAGGQAASSWEIGLITGLADKGIDVRDFDQFIGTSAGARVAAQISGGLALEELFERQIDTSIEHSVVPSGIDFKRWRDDLIRAKSAGGDTHQILMRIGSLGPNDIGDLGVRRRQWIASQLPSANWPDTKIRIATVETETGDRCVFHKSSGIELIDAVTASGAVAGIYPPVLFNSHHYMDGGFYSTDNADLATGSDRVLIFALREGVPPISLVPIEQTLKILQDEGAQIEIIHPDEETESVFKSARGGLLDPSVCEPAARAGRRQGRHLAGMRLKKICGRGRL